MTFRPSYPLALLPYCAGPAPLASLCADRRLFIACMEARAASRPSGDFGPVDSPPCIRQRFLPSQAGALHLPPLLVRAPHFGRSPFGTDFCFGDRTTVRTPSPNIHRKLTGKYDTVPPPVLA